MATRRVGDEFEFAPLSFKELPLTPIQAAVGFRVAEDILDGISLPDYLLLECLGLGWDQQAIAELFEVDRSWVSIRLKQLRVNLANSQLHKLLQVNQFVKEVARGEA